MRWFSGRPVTAGGEGLEAYKDGRADERARIEHDAPERVIDRGALEDAYARGRREERLRHRGSPLLALVAFILVAVAVIFLFLAAQTGSFSGAGAVVDNMIQAPVHGAADRAGNALVNAGQNLKQNAGSGS